MIDTLIEGIASWIRDRPLQLHEPLQRDQIHQLVNSAAKEQQNIGWDHALRGRISKRWIS